MFHYYYCVVTSNVLTDNEEIEVSTDDELKQAISELKPNPLVPMLRLHIYFCGIESTSGKPVFIAQQVVIMVNYKISAIHKKPLF